MAATNIPYQASRITPQEIISKISTGVTWMPDQGVRSGSDDLVLLHYLNGISKIFPQGLN